MPKSQNKSVLTHNMMTTPSNNISNLNLNVLKRTETKVVAPRNPKLLKTNEVPRIKMRPSTYLQEMSLDTEQKLAKTHEMRLPKIIELLDMSETTHQKVSYVDIEEAMFQPFPSEIVFQNFKPFITIEVPLLLRNNDKVPRLVKVIQKDSPYFNIISPDDVSHKVAPGMASTFRICFTPEENKDYEHELVCMTEREKFVIPVKAIGARAILDFPDEINFKVSPVKHVNSKVILVRNIGNNAAKCTFHVNEPFSVVTEQNTLAVGDSMQITIEFEPIRVGDYEQDLVVRYDCGDEINVLLYGAAVDANVRLDKNTIRIDDTFISMANQRVVTIHNRSDVLVHYKFSPFATSQEEELRKMKFNTDLTEEEKSVKKRFFKECELDPTLSDRLSALTRTFHNRKQVVKHDPLLFHDDIFQLNPVEGDIWPNSFMDVTVVFRPTVAQTYHRTVFCDIVGRETRLPLKMRAVGMGPRCQLSFDSLDIGDVFAGSAHTYEVVLANKGDIDAIFGVLRQGNSKVFSITPTEGIVLPNGHQAITIRFSSNKIGKVSDEFVLAVDGSPQPLSFRVTGNVIGPTFHFDTPQLAFGPVSFGFRHAKTCLLRNTSLVPMNVDFRIPDDGNGAPSVSSELNEGEFRPVANPREFSVEPPHAVIRAQSEIKVKVVICSNTLKRYDLLLHVDVKGIGRSLVTLPLTARTMVPEIGTAQAYVNLGRCFVTHLYTESVQLTNDTDLPAKYSLHEQRRDDKSMILYSSKEPHGIIQPRCTVDVPIDVRVLQVGECSETLTFSTFGSTKQAITTQMHAKGEGPVVYYTPDKIDYGQIEVLTPTTRQVKVENESLIPADFTAAMFRKDSVFQVEPQEGSIAPGATAILEVTAFLNDAYSFQDKMLISILRGQTVSVALDAKGFGTSIVSDPPLAPSLDLGAHFADSKFQRSFRLTNRGRRMQQLSWSTEGHNPMQHRANIRKASNFNPNDMKYKDMIRELKMPSAPTFQIVPSRLSIKPGESFVVNLEGTSDMPKEVTETISCFSTLGKSNNKERIIKTVVHAHFITPVVKLNRDKITFRLDRPAHDTSPLTMQSEHFTLQNVSSLPLSCNLTTQYPFQIMVERGVAKSSVKFRLDINELVNVLVTFDPLFRRDFVTRHADNEVRVTFDEHPHYEAVKLHAEVNFPNLKLDKEEIDFGCILNDTEVAKYVDIKNSSPLPLSFRWSFMVHQGDSSIVYNGKLTSRSNRTSNISEMPPHQSQQQLDGDGSRKRDRTAEGEQDNMEEKKDKQKEDVNCAGGDDAVDEAVFDIPIDQHFALANDGMGDDRVRGAEPNEKTGSALDLRIDLDNVVPGDDDDNFSPPECDEEEEKIRCTSRMSSRYQPSHPTNVGIDGFPLLPWLDPGHNHVPNGVEEIFDILPLYGSLEPGETQRVTFTYYGHADVSCTAKAVCEVQGGPKYQVDLKGSASLIEYNFDKAEVDFGKQMFDQVACAVMRLHNTGQVGFDFEGLAGLGGGGLAAGIVPGVPVMEPMCGHVPAMKSVELRVYYQAGIPEKFHKTFEIQVAHFEPTVVNIRGEGVFHRLALDLPRIVPTNDLRLVALLKEAREMVEKEKRPGANERAGGKAVAISNSAPHFDDLDKSNLGHNMQSSGLIEEFEQAQDISTELEVQMEFERLMLREFALDIQQQQLPPQSSSSCSLAATAPTDKRSAGKSSKYLNKLRLSEYLLDFGYVVLGEVKSHIVRATNTSYFPFSFKPERYHLFQSGFSMDLDRVKQLPGFPDHETVDFKMTFDPRGGNLPVGMASANVPINIVGGPQINIRLRGIVAVPDLQVNTEMVDFETVQCGQCKVVTIQLFNAERVPCEWMSTIAATEVRKKKQTPFSYNNAAKRPRRRKPRHFEMMPDRGTMQPGSRANLQLKFMPTEDRVYQQKLVINIAQATSRIAITVRGRGLEPQLDFDPPMVTFGPILPHGAGVENEVVIRNPCPFPVEFYSLNFDEQYIMEEKLLRHMQGYDEYGNLLLPPRDAGESLPNELLEYNRLLEEEEADTCDRATLVTNPVDSNDSAEIIESIAAADNETDAADVVVVQQEATQAAEGEETLANDELTAEVGDVRKQHKEGVGELEITPVSKAIARHLGIDLSPEGCAARNRRGIAVVIHGPPSSGKTNLAVALATRYGTARLSIDSIVLDAISDGGSKAGLRARELCKEAARQARAAETDADNESTMGAGLSVEQLNAHTGVDEKGSKLAAPSVISTKRTSVLSKQTDAKTAAKDAATGANNSLTGVADHGAPIARRLSVSASVAGEEGLYSTVLPDQLLIEILADRFQLNDCHQGFVIDGVDTLFSAGHHQTVVSLLKAINNRRHIYMLALKLTFESFHQREKQKELEKAKSIVLDPYAGIDYDQLDEDEYEKLPEHVIAKMEKEKLEIKRKRIERETAEKQERQRQLEFERENEKRLMEDLKKKGKGALKNPKDSLSKKSSPGKPDVANPQRSTTGGGGSGRDSKLLMHKSSADTTEGRADAGSDLDGQTDAVDGVKKAVTGGNNKKAGKGNSKGRKESDGVDEEKPAFDDLDLSEEHRLIFRKFNAFDCSYKDISLLLEQWDRSILDVKRPATPEDLREGEDDTGRPSKKKKKETEKEKLERERVERERLEREKAEREKMEKLKAEGGEGAEDEPIIGVPLLPISSDLLASGWSGGVDEHLTELPSAEDILEGLGLGPNGPPIPPPVTFSVVPCPVKRKAPSPTEASGKFVFVQAPVVDEVADAAEAEAEELLKIEKEVKAVEQLKGKGKKEKGGGARKSSPASRKHRRNSQEDLAAKSPLPEPEEEVGKEERKLASFRWVVPAESELPLKIHFKSDGLGQFDQTLDFELTSTRRKYQLFCRGISGFPTVSRDPRVVFPRRRKQRLAQDEIVSKRWLGHESYFEFGPLLCGKTRERYKEKRYAENVETLTIRNPSPLQGAVSFCFQHDVNATTFILDPPAMTLEPGESQPLSVWAYPKTAGRFTDSIVCCVRENPEPITFDVACYGVRPEIELDRKLVQFDKILLHRKDTKTLFLRNITLLPVAWRVAGMENLGDDFTVNQESGVIGTHGEFGLQLHFRATRPTTVKKMIRIEVYDVDNIMGLVQAENVQVTAEAYDVALDMSFPKGSDGGIDFGTIRVLDESKQICSLKNKGKYEIGFNFVFEPAGPHGMNIESLFSVLPQKGMLVANDRPTQVQVVFTSDAETTIRDLPLLKCQVLEPNLGEGKEVIASIPIKLSAKSLFSKYEVYPKADINFGPMLLLTRKTRTFTIVNNGEFDFKFSINKLSRDATKARGLNNSNSKREGSSSSRSFGKKNSNRQDTVGGQARLQLGPFTISPGVGTIMPGSSQNIQVDCFVEGLGRQEEYLGIDVSDRDPRQDPFEVMYKLMAEGCLPSIETCDPMAVFEEHRVVPNMGVVAVMKDLFDKSGIFSEEDNRFHFTNVIVGRRAQARFKISNINKVPVDITAVLKPLHPKAKLQDNFEVEPNKMQIPPHDHVYITVTFAPVAMQQYGCFFETTVDGLPPSVTRGRVISFELQGEGSIPRVVVVQPRYVNKARQPLMAFKRTLLGRSDHLQLALKNEGIFNCQVNLILEEEEEAAVASDDESVVNKTPRSSHAQPPQPPMVMTSFKEHKVFSLVPSTGCKPAHVELHPNAPGAPPYTCSVWVQAGTVAYFDLHFRPRELRVSNGRVRVQIVDNQFEQHEVQLYGESFRDDVTLDNLHDETEIATVACRRERVVDVDALRRNLSTSSDNGTSRGELLDLGDCYVSRTSERTFTLTNNSSAHVYRFAWERTDKFAFRPQCGHLHPGCCKEITLVYTNPDKPETLVRQLVKCELAKISFASPNDVVDWDDRLQTIKWVDISKEEKKQLSGGHAPAKKKVMETEPEPAHTVVSDEPHNIELFISARANYATFTCDTKTIAFKDTLMMQPRVYEFTMSNTGEVQLDYTWCVAEHHHHPDKSGSHTSNSRTPSLLMSPRTQSPAYHPVGASLMADGDLASALDNKPFSITPAQGAIATGDTQTFTVRFAPVDVGDYQSFLLCDVHNMNHGGKSVEEAPSISVRGRSIMPHCHFDFEDSDYLSRTNNSHVDSAATTALTSDEAAALERKTRCFELNSVGSSKSAKHFWIHNPTSQSYRFRWVCGDDGSAPSGGGENCSDNIRPAIVCARPCGELCAGKKLLVTFTFTPQQLGTIESWWRFVIDGDDDLSVPFLVVGHCREPRLTLSLAHLNFKPSLVGRSTSETVHLVNRESTPFTFSVKPSSCHADASPSKLVISPMEGTVEANSKLALTLGFQPKTADKSTFTLVVGVARKFNPLIMHVKATSYAMDVRLACENSLGHRIELSKSGLNAINLGEVQLLESCMRKMHITNVGSYVLRYHWKLVEGKQVTDQTSTEYRPPAELSLADEGETCGGDGEVSAAVKSSPVLQVTPGCGEVHAGETKTVTMIYQPKRTTSLRHTQLVMEVPDGPSFTCQINGTGVNPGLEFSFTRHNFGACFVYKAGMPQNQAVLKLVNRSAAEISIKCLYKNTEHFEVRTAPLLLLPNEGTHVPIRFYPRACTSYRERIPFRINGLSTREVEVRGEGIEMKVEVANPKQKIVKLGACHVGRRIKHVVPIINHSPRPINLNLSVTPLSTDLLEEGVIRVSPPGTVQLLGNGGTRDVEIVFSPQRRIAPFSEELMMECAGLSQPLFLFTGCCQGIEIELDQESIPFGAVVLNSRTKRRFTMRNVGDIGASFKWNIAKFRPDFSISPVKGYISPGMEIPFAVEFHPTQLSQDIRYEGLMCRVENYRSLPLTLTGMCIPAPSLKEVISFNTVVRVRDVRSIVMSNRSSLLWTLKPVIEGDFFSGPDTFVVEPGATKNYEIEYYPLLMTNDSKHQGAVFFPIPDGSGLLYNLVGNADPPKPLASINRDVPCKTSYVEMLNIHNWLDKAQRFRVTVEMIKPDRLDPSTTLKGMDYLDVPAAASRDYKLRFFAYKEGSFAAKVIFRNERTGEYVYFFVNLRATSPGVIGCVELQTAVRRGVSHTIHVENPLPTGVTFYSDCKLAEINLPPQIVVPAYSTGSYTFEYQPLKVGESGGKLTLSSQELGQYSYDLALKAIAGGNEKTNYFSAQLGLSHTLTVKFVSYAKQKTEYQARFSNPMFGTEQQRVTAAPSSSSGGTEVTIDVTYEPTQLGAAHGTMTLVSAVGGEYSFPLVGECTHTKPQGPFSIKKGGKVDIPFKNIYAQTTQFNFSVDSELFHVKAMDHFKSKKTQNIQVTFDGAMQPKSVHTGKLTVTPSASPQAHPPSWVFYLKGLAPDH